MKKITILFITCMLLVLTGCAKEEDLTSTLTESLSDYALYYSSHGEDSGTDFIDYAPVSNGQDNFPEYFDLREKGIVTSVKDQGSHGTCWSFGALGASEVSILNELGLTKEEYKQKYGKDLDLSEFFHAYFTFKPVYHGDETEGLTLIEEIDDEEHFNAGGNDMNTMSTLSNLFGPNNESDYPYDGEYTYPKDKRYTNEFMLQNVDFLVNPSGVDENGNYKYIEEGTNSIKRALLNGDAVTISYYASMSYENISYEEAYSRIKDIDYDEDLKVLYAKLRSNTADTNLVSREKALELIEFRLAANNFEEDLYNFDGYDKDFILDFLFSPFFGYEQDEAFDLIAHEDEYFLINPETFGQYTYYQVPSDHEVMIVGYDDNYSKDNFLQAHRPPQDGAWIVKNSWGEETYDGGYFYLSYYDESIDSPAVYNYYLNDEKPSGDINLYTYDLMCISGLSSTSFDSKLSLSNVYEIENDGTIFSIGINTADYNTDVTFEIYKLSSLNSKPDKGQKLYSGNETYMYAGYHTHDLDKEINVNKGDIISIVISQKVDGKYVLVNGFSLSKAGYEALENEEIEFIDGFYPVKIGTSIISNNESYIKYGSTWYDYRQEIENVTSNSKECNYLTYDNPAIKLLVELN